VRDSTDRDPVEILADSFLARFRNGERPSIEEYAAKYPELADQIRELLPALVVLEQEKSVAGAPNGTGAGLGQGSDAADTGSTPRQLGDYLILREIGRGGMGVVYESVQQSLGRHVALKVLPRQALAGSSQLERFRLEARAAAQLHHTNIVPVFGVGECEGVHYYAMQFIQGQGLDIVIDALRRVRDGGAAAGETRDDTRSSAGADEARLTAALTGAMVTGQFAARRPAPARAQTAAMSATEGPHSGPEQERAEPRPSWVGDLQAIDAGSSAELSSSEGGAPYYRSVARVGVQVAEALAHAHGHGILHRDIKPSNLLLDANGTVWVTDFGLAKAEGSDALTNTGDIVGTIRYMAPERFSGWSDPRSDVYALGATLYELATLGPPFCESDRLKLIQQVLHDEPLPPRKFDRRVPRDLETIVLKALAKEPGQRYTTAEQMAEDLRRFAADRPILARRSSAIERTWRWCKRNPSLAGAIGIVAGALVTVAAISVIHAGKQAQATNEISGLASTLRGSLAESNRLLATRNLDRGQAAFEKGEIGPGMLWMIECWRSAIDAGDLAWQHAARANLAAWWPYYGRLKAVLSHPSPVVAAAFSADNCTVISGSEDGTAQVWDSASGMPKGPPLRHAKTVFAVAFSPDGKLAMTGSYDNTAQVWNATTGEPIGTRLNHQGPVIAVAFHPGGKMVLTGSRDNTARLWDAVTGKPMGPPLRHTGEVAALAFSPDGKSFAISSQDSKTPVGRARLWDVASLQPIGGLLQPGGLVQFSPDGRTLWTGGWSAQRWDASTGRPLGPRFELPASLTVATISPDTKTIISSSTDFTVRQWDTSTRRAFGLSQQFKAVLRAAAFSPDGKTLVTGFRDKRARLWDVATGQFLGFLEHRGPVIAVAFSSDGKTILTAGEDGTMRLWDAGWRPPVGQSVDVPSESFVYKVSPDLAVVATARAGAHDSHIQLWDGATGRAAAPEIVVPAGTSLIFSPDGKTLLAIIPERKIQLWDVSTGAPLGPAHEQPQPVGCIAFSPDSKALLLGGTEHIAWIWDVPTASLRGKTPMQRGSVDAVAWSPDGRTFATGLEIAEVQIWDAATCTVLGEPIRHPGAVGQVVFTPDGKAILISGEDGTARLWDLARREPRIPPLSHEGGYLWGLNFSPDGKTIITGGDDQAVRLWDVGTGQPIGPMLKRESRVMDARFSLDGTRLITRDLSAIRIDSVPSPLPDDVERLSAWVEVFTGLTLERRQGLIGVLDNAAWQKRRLRLMELGGPPETGTEEWPDPILLGPDPSARARFWLERGCSDPVQAEFAQAIRLRPENLQIRYCHVVSLVVLGDRAGVRQECCSLLERFGGSTNPSAANDIAWACVLAPAAVADCKEPVRLAEVAVGGALRREKPLYLNTLGAAFYRAGRFQEAIGRLEEGIRLRQGQALPQDCIFLALAHHRLGHDAQARSWLGRFETYVPSKVPQQFWNELEIRLLRNEAEFVILNRPAFPSNPFARGGTITP
jgi:WD40 repeat protein/serine/threonine protein kinase